MDRVAVERFVRETLGCGCPAEVFRDLYFNPGNGIHDGAIHVGGRLLVLLLNGSAGDTRFGKLLVAGRDARDALGYNRVRFVVVTDDPVLAGAAEAAFTGCQVRDDRTHLHVVSPGAVPSLD